ncbi:MAG TPA: sigma 54-interacting transcriptional regulator [Planctomycetota bacterium]
MERPALPPDEEARRLDVLRSYEILNTPPEDAFDDIARLANFLCGTPIALVTLIDEKREWFKARVGVDLEEATREGFCSHTILGRDLLVVPDSLRDPRFADNPYVVGPPGVRFYAGAPLITPDGPVIGTLCVLDVVPRTWTPELGLALERLARQVQTHLELRRALLHARRAEEAIRASALRSMSHEEALIELARSCFEGGPLEDVVRRIARHVADILSVDRVNVWSYCERRRAIRRVAGYERSGEAASARLEISADDYPRYFEALRREEVIAADDARTDPRTSELAASYLAPLNISSMMDAPIFTCGVLEGVLCHEHVGPPRVWTMDEQVFALAVANLIALAMEQAERRRIEGELELSEERRLRAEDAARERSSFERLVGKSEPMRETFRKLRLAAKSDVTVLLTGESGTGKELAALAVHALSARKAKPFVAVNCSAIPETLLESEMFGHVKGAFTGAIRDKAGLFQEADGGTLFLDEIGDMSPVLQVKVLRALQEREVRRVGDDKATKVDVRILAATNRDLGALVSEGKIREDFYYRVKVFDIHLPPLRERRDDIPLLVEHFLDELSKSRHRPLRGVHPDAMRALLAHDWPGNVRELRNAMERAVVTLTGDVVTLADLPPQIRPMEAVGEDGDGQKRRILDALAKSGGSRERAAKLLGMSRVTLWKRMSRLGLVVKPKR